MVTDEDYEDAFPQDEVGVEEEERNDGGEDEDEDGYVQVSAAEYGGGDAEHPPAAPSRSGSQRAIDAALADNGEVCNVPGRRSEQCLNLSLPLPLALLIL